MIARPRWDAEGLGELLDAHSRGVTYRTLATERGYSVEGLRARIRRAALARLLGLPLDSRGHALWMALRRLPDVTYDDATAIVRHILFNRRLDTAQRVRLRRILASECVEELGRQ
jgi:hypothetical protein